MNRQKWHKPSIINTLIIACTLLALGLFFTITYNSPKPIIKTPTMTIFVHGSFGSLLGFLSLTDVLNDHISGSTYRNVTKKMRMDDFFFKDQPILDRGLRRFTPTLDPTEINNKKYAVYPLAKAIEIIEQTVRPHHEQDLFYTFGWTGIISQQSRRFEAIRFYNALTEELAKLRIENIVPRIRLIAHSHGGNLCLNLAAIQTILSTKIFSKNHVFSADPDEQESILKMLELFEALKTKELAQMQPDQKAYDYLPSELNLHINELIMLGTPIQPETESFCYAPLFSTVYNLYSDEDKVQKSDWVSSKKSLSNARINKKPAGHGRSARVIQAQIIAHDKPEQQKGPSAAESEQSLFQDFMAGKNIFARNSAAPTHKELWFFTWKNSDQSFDMPITPLPLAALIPMITMTLHKTHINDVTITLKQTDDTFSVVASHNEKIIHTTTIPLTLITDLQAKAQRWAPNDTSGMSEFEAVYKHLTE